MVRPLIVHFVPAVLVGLLAAGAAVLVHATEPLSFVAASDADFASYRAFYADAPLAAR